MNEKINIQELIQLLSDRLGVGAQDAESFIKEFFLLIESGLERDKYVKVKGLGTFKLIDVDNRESVDVNTGERIEIQGHTKISFTPENTLKELVNRPFSHFEAVVLNDHVNFEDASEEGTEEERSSEETAAIEQTTMQPDVLPDTEQTMQPEVVMPSEDTDEPEVESGADQKCSEITNVVEQAVSDNVPEETVREALPEASVPVHDLHQKTVGDEKNQAVVSNRRSGGVRLFAGIMSAVMLCCACVVLALYWDSLFLEKEVLPQGQSDPTESWHTAWEDSTEQLAAVEDVQAEANEQTSQKQHSLLVTEATQQKATPSQPQEQIQKQAAENIQQPVQPTQPVKKEKVSPAKTLKADSVSYVIVGTQVSYTMKAGETLTKVALRFYGTKALWPYIVKHNKGVIKNPDNVPYGTVIQIPKLEKKL